MSHIPEDRDVAYCSSSSIPACCLNLMSRLGFLREDDPDSFSLKWTPCFFNDRKCENLVLIAESGDPGGDAGISRSGTGGNVRSWIKPLDVENGEDRPNTK
jgi:hypothetical protein